MERKEAKEKELRRLSALLVEHQAVLRSLHERPCQEPLQVLPPRTFNQLRHEVVDYLPSTINTDRGEASRTGQVPDLHRPPTIKRVTFEDILTDVEVPTTPQRQVQFADMATSTPIERLTECLVERTPQIGVSQVPLYSHCQFTHPEPPKDLFEEGFGCSLPVAAMEFKKL